MSSDQQLPLDPETRNALIEAMAGDIPEEPVSDEDLAMVAERGLGSFPLEQQDRILHAMAMNTNGAAGTVDVFRFFHEEKLRKETVGAGDQSDPEPRHRFDLISRSMAGAWAIAASIALLLSIGLLSTPSAPLGSENGLSGQSGIGISDQKSTEEGVIQSFLRSLFITQDDPSAVAQANSTKQSIKYWLAGSVLVMVLLPPAYLMYRKRRD